MIKNTICGDFSLNKKGGAVCQIHSDSEEDKCFAAFVKCGHCGEGYFIPIILTAICKDLEAAKEIVINTPRVKKYAKGSIIDVFEISYTEFRFIHEVNNGHDSYLNPDFNHDSKVSDVVQGRRIILNVPKVSKKSRFVRDQEDMRTVKTQQDYDQLWNMFERNFAPIYVGDKLVFPNVNRQKAMHDYYKSATIRFGINKDDPTLMVLYYLLFGKDNDLGISLNGSYVSYMKDRKGVPKKVTIAIPERLEKKFNNFLEKHDGILSCKPINDSRSKEVKWDTVAEDKELKSKRMSQVDKFNARFNKFKQKSQNKEENLNQEPQL